MKEKLPKNASASFKCAQMQAKMEHPGQKNAVTLTQEQKLHKCPPRAATKGGEKKAGNPFRAAGNPSKNTELAEVTKKTPTKAANFRENERVRNLERKSCK